MRLQTAYILRRIGMAVLAAAAVGCGSHPPVPERAASPGYNYLIGPLDTLHIVLWRNPDLSMTVPVRPDGKVSVPLVEDLPALGKNSTQLARDDGPIHPSSRSHGHREE